MTRAIGDEEHLLRQILDLAALTGWRAFHMENATSLTQRRGGYYVRKRNVNPDGVGFPDLVLVHPRRRRLIFAELKRDAGPRGGTSHNDSALTPEQVGWIDALNALAPEIDVAVWRPVDWPAIEKELVGS